MRPQDALVVSPPARPASGRPGRSSAGSSARSSGFELLAAAALVGLAVVATTDQVVPASSAHQAELRIWLVGRAAGIVAYLLLGFQVTVGLVLSHPTNKTTWKLSRRLFPWHQAVWVFVLAFLAAHVVTLVLDPYAGVGLGGALIPGASAYRSGPVALGTIGLYALLVTGLTARYTRLLPAGAWLSLHRLSLGVFVLAWLHGLLAGTDGERLSPFYLVTGSAVAAAAGYRYWILPRRRSAAPVPASELGGPGDGSSDNRPPIPGPSPTHPPPSLEVFDR